VQFDIKYRGRILILNRIGKNVRSGGKVLVDQLVKHGVDRVFCVPGESYLEILDSLYDVKDKIAVNNARHEAGASNMAEAYGKLTGKPGVALVTRGPGACHASIGVHIAFQDSTPLILIVGQVSQAMIDREAFQEIDYQAMFGSVAKWSVQIDRADRIPEYISRAFNVANSGRKGPVVLALPEDILEQMIDVEDSSVAVYHQAAPEINTATTLTELLANASKPLILLGGSGWDEGSSGEILSFAMKNFIPVSTSFRRQDLIDNNQPVFCGAFGTSVPPTLLKRIKESDLLIVLGARLGEMTTQGYETINIPTPKQNLVHVHIDPNEIGSVYSPTLGVVSSMKSFTTTLCNLNVEIGKNWKVWCSILHSEFLLDSVPPDYQGNLDLGAVCTILNKELPLNAIVTLDAGNHTGWPQRFLMYSPSRRQVGSTCGAMGYSIPAAVASSLIFPNRVVLGLVGDGGFMMSGMELMTAIQYSATPIIIIFNNSSYGTIRMHQEREHPGRVIATDLVNPDFKKMAESMGVYSEIIKNTEEFLPAFRRCLKQKTACLLELKTDIYQLSSRFTLNS